MNHAQFEVISEKLYSWKISFVNLQETLGFTNTYAKTIKASFKTL